MLFVFMGVSGCGKSTLGAHIAARFSLPLYEGDDFHPQSNVDLMKSATPLTGAHRDIWIDAIVEALRKDASEHLLLACSALNRRVRERLTKRVNRQTEFIWLSASFATIEQRLLRRKAHFMPASLLQSQFDALEPPSDAVVVDVEGAQEDAIAIVKKMIEARIAK